MHCGDREIGSDFAVTSADASMLNITEITDVAEDQEKQSLERSDRPATRNISRCESRPSDAISIV